MLQPRRLHRYTYADYVGIEMYSDTKHEFLDGEIYAMAGGSKEHAALAGRMLHALINAVGARPCEVYGSDLRIYVESVGLATFPDVSVVCGPFQQHPASPESTATNPSVLVEVTSPSSEEYDIGPKREYYQTIPTLREYVIVSYRERRITVHVRTADTWTTHEATGGESIELPSLQATIDVDDIYGTVAVP